MQEHLINKLLLVPGIGLSLATSLIQAGVKSVADLKTKKFNSNLPVETKLYLLYKTESEFPYEFARQFIKLLPDYLTPVGSYRRKCKTMHDIDLLTKVNLQLVAKNLQADVKVMGFYATGDSKMSMICEFQNKYIRVDVFKTTDDEWPFALLHFTGGRLFNIKTRSHAKRLGYKLSQNGLWHLGTSVAAKTEEDILTTIGLKYVEPELRDS